MYVLTVYVERWVIKGDGVGEKWVLKGYVVCGKVGDKG